MATNCGCAGDDAAGSCVVFDGTVDGSRQQRMIWVGKGMRQVWDITNWPPCYSAKLYVQVNGTWRVHQLVDAIAADTGVCLEGAARYLLDTSDMPAAAAGEPEAKITCHIELPSQQIEIVDPCRSVCIS